VLLQKKQSNVRTWLYGTGDTVSLPMTRWRSLAWTLNELAVDGYSTDHDNTIAMTKITVDLVNLVSAEQNNEQFKHRVL
jgi:hypothetical protein